MEEIKDALTKREAWRTIVDTVFDQVVTPIEKRTNHVSKTQVELARESAKLPRRTRPRSTELGEPDGVEDPAGLFDVLQRELAALGLELVRRP